jgi:hypothetical protein
MTYQEACNEILKLESEVTMFLGKENSTKQLIKEKQEEFQRFYQKLKKEKVDVEKLEKTNLSSLIYKISGKYDEKFQKEYQEYITAKTQYDEFSIFMEDLELKLSKCDREIAILQSTLLEKKHQLRNDFPEGQLLAKQEREQQVQLLRQRKELEEAINETMNVYQLAKSAKEEYEAAHSYATFDLFGGGIVGDIAKYDHISNAANLVMKLKSASWLMNKEIGDVKQDGLENLDEFTQHMQAVDMFFDNIFTDISVRNRIQRNIEQLDYFIQQLEEIMQDLRSKQRKNDDRLKELECNLGDAEK